jgi:hypothetical protein
MSGSPREAQTRRPVGDVLRGIELYPLPEGWTPMEALTVIKCLDADGNPTWCTRRTAGINDEELLGAMTLQVALLKRDILADWEDDPDDE